MLIPAVTMDELPTPQSQDSNKYKLHPSMFLDNLFWAFNLVGSDAAQRVLLPYASCDVCTQDWLFD